MEIDVAEIVLPEAKPEFEWILGQAVQKVSPLRKHALMQGQLMHMLLPWAEEFGEVGSEWRFRVAPPGEIRRPLVPDVAFVSFEREGDLVGHDLELPALAPNVAFEIRSPDDRWKHIAHKIDVYLRAGTDAVVRVDPDRRTLAVYDSEGEQRFEGNDTFAHPSLAGFTFALDTLFGVLDRRGRRG